MKVPNLQITRSLSIQREQLIAIRFYINACIRLDITFISSYINYNVRLLKRSFLYRYFYYQVEMLFYYAITKSTLKNFYWTVQKFNVKQINNQQIGIIFINSLPQSLLVKVALNSGSYFSRYIRVLLMFTTSI